MSKGLGHGQEAGMNTFLGLHDSHSQAIGISRVCTSPPTKEERDMAMDRPEKMAVVQVRRVLVQAISVSCTGISAI